MARLPTAPLTAPSVARLLAAGLGLLLASAVATTAATLKARTEADAIAAADRIVRGRVEAVRTERRPGSGLIETVARLRVVDDFTGGAERTIEIRELGGTVGDTTLSVPGAARFVVGDDIVALVERRGGGWRPSAMAASVFGVRRSAAGLELVAQAADLPASAGPAAPARRGLGGFTDAVRRVRGREPLRLSSPDAPVAGALATATPVVEAFKLLGNMRWHEADTGAQVVWYRNTLKASPLDSGNSDAELTGAMAAWTNPVSAGLTLTYGGTHGPVAGASLLNCGAPPTPGAGLITYEDPDDDITTSGVIAIGGACSSSGVTRTVNGTSFSKITYGFVIFTTKAEMPQLGSSLFLSRVATHEVGHAIGLGHTPTDGTVTAATGNIMYPSCCQSTTPVPPAIGPDDLAGVEFIYPASSAPPATCTYAVTPATQTVTSGGGVVAPFTVTTADSCQWSVGGAAAWLTLTGPTSRTGSGTVSFTATGNTGAARSSSFSMAGTSVTVQQAAAPVVTSADTDGDGMPDAWETRAGLSPTSAVGADGASGDPDGDGLTNLQEYQRQLHPLGFVRRYLAEGVQSDFFSTRFALVNPSPTTSANVQLRLSSPPDATGVVVTREHWLTIAPRRRATVDASTIAGIGGSFATTVEANTLVVVDRTVSWDGAGYGSHAESATEAPRTTWYFAEGATMGGFNTFYLLLNPGASPAAVTVTYLRAGRAPRTKTYDVPAGARQTVWVDMEVWEDGDSLAAAEVSARIDASVPIIAERAMYLDRNGQLFTAGHDSVGLTEPSTRWLLAEGATGAFFDLFILLANPASQAADVRLRFLLGDGTVIEHRQSVPALSRATVWVDALGRDQGLIAQNPAFARLADTAVSTDVIVDNGVGVLVERAMWWPGDASTWAEAHNSGGITQTATRWALAEGEVGGPRNTRTYVLVSNPGDSAASVTVTVLYEGQAAETQTYPVGANSRFNLALGEPGFFPNAAGRRVGLIVESATAPVVVERAMYSDAAGTTWAAGTNAVATRLP